MGFELCFNAKFVIKLINGKQLIAVLPRDCTWNLKVKQVISKQQKNQDFFLKQLSCKLALNAICIGAHFLCTLLQVS